MGKGGGLIPALDAEFVDQRLFEGSILSMRFFGRHLKFFGSIHMNLRS